MPLRPGAYSTMYAPLRSIRTWGRSGPTRSRSVNPIRRSQAREKGLAEQDRVGTDDPREGDCDSCESWMMQQPRPSDDRCRTRNPGHRVRLGTAGGLHHDPPAGARSESVTVSPDVGSPDRGQGVRSTVDDESRIGLQLKDFSIDLNGTASTVANSTRLTRA